MKEHASVPQKLLPTKTDYPSNGGQHTAQRSKTLLVRASSPRAVDEQPPTAWNDPTVLVIKSLSGTRTCGVRFLSICLEGRRLWPRRARNEDHLVVPDVADQVTYHAAKERTEEEDAENWEQP